MTDGTAEYNAANYRLSTYYDLAKTAALRLAFSQGKELAPHGGTAVALTPGWMRSEMMLDIYGVTEENWREGDAATPTSGRSRSPPFRRPRGRRARRRPGRRPPQRRLLLLGGLAREYGFTDLDGSQPDAWRYMVEVQDPGLRPTRPGIAERSAHDEPGRPDQRRVLGS